MIEDRLLMWRCKQGSRSAFRRIYEKYQGDLRNLAANLLDDRTAAEQAERVKWTEDVLLLSRLE